jgi:hypothetical protein
MKSQIRNILTLACLTLVISCAEYEEKAPYPILERGASLRPIPTPWTSRPRLSLASPGTAITISMFSYNPEDLAKVEIYASYLSTTAVPAAAGSGSYANFIAPVGTGGMLLPQFPDSGTAPVTISYARYDVLVNGKTVATATTPSVSFTPLPRTLLKTLNGSSEISANQSFTLTELATATGTTLPVSSSTTIASQPAFLLTFVVTKTDGSVFSYVNSGPGINSNPATGKVIAHTWEDPATVNVVPKPAAKVYNVIVNGDEGSPFLPGLAIRVAP